MRVVKRPELGKLVTPLPNRRLPVHNWFLPKEGFSRDLVAMLINSFWLYKGDLVLDPFVGGGTTCLTCKEFGIDSLGLDVHPLMLLMARAKTQDYEVAKLEEKVQGVLKAPPAEPPERLSRFFPRPVLQEIWGLRQEILQVEGEVRDFLLVGLLRAAMECSWAYKDGAVVKVRRRPLPSFRETLSKTLGWMLDDLRRLKTKPARTEIRDSDARLGIEEEVDAVITSPPYLNKSEYCTSYWVEEEICGLERRGPEVFLGSTPVRKSIPEVDKVLPEQTEEVRAYFYDMFQVFERLQVSCRRGAKVALITSDAGFRDRVVEVCLPLCQLAEEVGFKARKMLVVNERFCTTPSRRKIGKIKEALLFFEKQ
ncbi:MAG: DNA methyltransferase [Candidatus Hadarchaeales archaeon]